VEPGAILYALLSQAAPVVALLGHAQAGLRIYPLRAPQGTPLPYAVYQVVSGQADATMQCDLDDTARVQLSIFAATYPDITVLHAACRAAAHGQRVGTATIDFDSYQESFQDGATCYLRTQDYLFEGLTP
jgi:hypothetical protein